jgi:hypothetical protein
LLTWIDAEEYATLRSADLAACLSDEDIERIEMQIERDAERPTLGQRIRNAFSGGHPMIETYARNAADEDLRDADMVSHSR